METDMGCLFPPAKVFNDLCLMLLLYVIVSQQYSVTMVHMLPLKDKAAYKEHRG